MNTAKLSKTFAVLTLAGAALFSGAASADTNFYGPGFRGYELQRSVWGPNWGPGWNDRRNFRFEDSVDARQERQSQRIEQGVRSGGLTPHEARRLMREQRQISRLERDFRADGWLDPHERRVLDRELDDAGRHIRHQKHDPDWR